MRFEESRLVDGCQRRSCSLSSLINEVEQALVERSQVRDSSLIVLVKSELSKVAQPQRCFV